MLFTVQPKGTGGEVRRGGTTFPDFVWWVGRGGEGNKKWACPPSPDRSNAILIDGAQSKSLEGHFDRTGSIKVHLGPFRPRPVDQTTPSSSRPPGGPGGPQEIPRRPPGTLNTRNSHRNVCLGALNARTFHERGQAGSGHPPAGGLRLQPSHFGSTCADSFQ